MPEGGLAREARGLVAGWAGQSGVLVPWGCDCGCSPGFLRHLPSHSDLGVNLETCQITVVCLIKPFSSQKITLARLACLCSF